MSGTTLRHVDLGIVPVARTCHVLIAAELLGLSGDSLLEGLTWSDLSVTLLHPESGAATPVPTRDKVSQMAPGLYRLELEPLQRAGRYHLYVRDTRSPPRFHPCLGRLDARAIGAEAFVQAEPDVTASLVFVTSMNMIKARVGVCQGGRLVPVEAVKLVLFDERSASPIEFDPVRTAPTPHGFVDLELRGVVPSGLRIYAGAITVTVAGETYECARLFPVVRVGG
ncbi:MAG: hypothetical protein AB1486_31530 [Planctomycetota bacterium]